MMVTSRQKSFRVLFSALLLTFFVYVVIDMQLVSVGVVTKIVAQHSWYFYEDPRRSTWQTTRELQEAFSRFPPMKDALFKTHQLEVKIANEIPLNRSVEDTRPKGCSDKYTPPASGTDPGLPTVTIVMPMHNEVWSMLLRSIHSIILQTDWRLISEIIVVDDASTFDELKDSLDRYVALLPVKTLVLRNPSRQGLMRSRVNGARVANGSVIVFMDAHTEANVDWLVPVLREIESDPLLLAIPHLDTINPYTIKYDPWRARMHGTFDWDLDYVWKFAPPMSSDLDLVPTAAVSGSVMATRKDTFFRMGAFDEGMDIWGGENVEIVFRYWMCGGRTMIVPCSRVGHIFRPTLPYTFPRGTDVIDKNYARIAEIWMDDYRKFFYAAKSAPRFSENDLASLRERMRLKERLRCANFTWFLNTVASDVAVPHMDDDYHGLVHSVGCNECIELDKLSRHSSLTDCVRSVREQKFSFSSSGHLRTADGRSLCPDAFGRLVVDSRCPDGGWKYDVTPRDHPIHKVVSGHDGHRPIGRMLYNGQCLTYVTSSSGRREPELMPCPAEGSKEDNNFYWMFTYRLDYSRTPPNYHQNFV